MKGPCKQNNISGEWRANKENKEVHLEAMADTDVGPSRLNHEAYLDQVSHWKMKNSCQFNEIFLQLSCAPTAVILPRSYHLRAEQIVGSFH